MTKLSINAFVNPCHYMTHDGIWFGSQCKTCKYRQKPVIEKINLTLFRHAGFYFPYVRRLDTLPGQKHVDTSLYVLAEHPRTMGTNVCWPPLFREGFPLDFGEWQWEFEPIQPRHISEGGHRCSMERPYSQPAFQLIPKVFSGLDVRALFRPVNSTPALLNHGKTDLTSCWNRKRLSPHRCHKFSSTQLSKMF